MRFLTELQYFRSTGNTYCWFGCDVLKGCIVS